MGRRLSPNISAYIMTLDECDRMFEVVRKASTPAEACHALEPLFSVYEVISIELTRGTIFWRARIAQDQPWTSITEMGYPPKEHVTHGRLNDKHSPCFYAATRDNTALAEIGVNEGDYAQIAGFRVKLETPIRVAVVGELYHVQKTGYLRLTGTDPGLSINRHINSLDMEHARCLLYIDAFLAHLLADPNAGQSNYTLSRAVASMIYRNTEIDGINFPSVRDTHGMNLALKPVAFDAKVHPVCCMHTRIHKLHLFGFVDYEVLQDVERITDDGTLVWLSPKARSIRRYFNLTKAEFEAAAASSCDSNAFLDLMSAHSRDRYPWSHM